jgi:hypothetical protein
VVALAAHPPRPIPVDTDAVDLEERADPLKKVFGALSVYLIAILDDTGKNSGCGLDFLPVEAVLSGLVSDVTGTIQCAADAGRVA